MDYQFWQTNQSVPITFRNIAYDGFSTFVGVGLSQTGYPGYSSNPVLSKNASGLQNISTFYSTDETYRFLELKSELYNNDTKYSHWTQQEYADKRLSEVTGWSYDELLKKFSNHSYFMTTYILKPKSTQ